jgi:heparan-alpha-glucosaminide N-acetyltransferase
MKAVSSSGRTLSIDAFRGLTIFVMVFVNQVAGVAGMPQALRHMPADADGMTLVDVVFPAFLFIVGMSLPLALRQRRARGDIGWRLWQHVLVRTLGLLVFGVFMLNAESGYSERHMVMPIALWSLLFYAAALLVWLDDRGRTSAATRWRRGLGIAALLVLALLYRGGADGSEPMAPQWWGILGLIGWAYLIACVASELARGRVAVLVLAIAACLAYACAGRSVAAPALQWLPSQPGHAVHASIVLCGVLLSTLCFDRGPSRTPIAVAARAVLLALVLAAAGAMLRPYGVSKIHATPSWALFSAAWCALLFGLLHWVIEGRGLRAWTRLVQPAAVNPLLAYLIPFVIFAAMQWLGLAWPAVFAQGLPGLAWALLHAVVVMGLAEGLNRARIRLLL